MTLTMYVDASYTKDTHCITGWVALLGGAAVSWRCHKQTVRSDSSCAPEFRAAKEATKEVVWLRYLLEFLQAPQPAVPLCCDNKSAIHLMTGVAVRTNSRDLCRDLPMLRDWVTSGEILPRFVAGTAQSADFLTKQLNRPAFTRCCAAVGLTSVTATPLLHETAPSTQHTTSVHPTCSTCLVSTERGECYVDTVSIEPSHEYSGISELLTESC